MEGIACASIFDEEALNELLDAFGSKFSLEDIASAYYDAKGNVNVTGDILYARNHGSTSRATSNAYENKSVGASTTSSENTSINLNIGTYKSKRCSVSAGSVAGVIGKNYVKPRSSRKNCSDATKPVEIDSKKLLKSLIWSEEDPSSRKTRNSTTNGDLEKFLFQMLGDGFQLDKSVIQEVLDCCGYDVDKSMDKLLDMSASTLAKSDDVIGIAAEKFTGRCLENQSFLIQGKPQSKDFSQRNPKRSPRGNKDKVNQEREILEALFTVTETSEEAAKRNRVVSEVRRSKALGELVTEPLEDKDTSLTKNVVEMMKVSKDVEDQCDDDENSYDDLRQAVKEYWMTMKEYYKAAAEAYAEGDEARATKIMELGHIFNRKAREADEKSSAKMLESSCADDEIMSLDLRNFKPKEALNLLRIHLASVSGIPTIKYLRIIVGTIEEDTKKAARRRLIMKQLEKESIKWNEEENGRIISIRVDVINPKELSFAKENKKTGDSSN
ncbi:Silencing defective 5 [Hibiscus syriacus]|uniref:Silencing defective 5 n=1 Tax=Hibiscus syriacus TaxID=106335 RepID=A0A6A2XWK3_HIBSY|nr:Silencing defective 5 [Hibiscus syriacus]